MEKKKGKKETRKNKKEEIKYRKYKEEESK